MIPEGLLVKLEQPGPRFPPTLPQTGHPRHLDDPFMQFKVTRAEGLIVAPLDRLVQSHQKTPQPLRFPGKLHGPAGGMTGGEPLEDRTQFGESADVGWIHKKGT